MEWGISFSASMAYSEYVWYRFALKAAAARILRMLTMRAPLSQCPLSSISGKQITLISLVNCVLIQPVKSLHDAEARGTTI